MDVLLLSRFQFAFATMVHFLFIPLTLGLVILLALWETQYVLTGDETYKKMVKFWGKIFLINFALGVVTGINLEFQFGTNWSRFSSYAGDVFGSLLAIEATVAFFLESTFLGVWIFGWTRISPRLHALSIWLVALASNVSAFWIIVANAWMQHPVGYVMRNGRAELEDFFALITNVFAWHQCIHTLCASYILAGFLVMGVSAWHLLQNPESVLFSRSFAYGAGFSFLLSLVVIAQGHLHGEHVAHVQPAKFAAMESLWETKTWAPVTALVIPSEDEEKNLFEFLAIPGTLSFLAFRTPEAEVKGLKAWPKDERPPVLLTSMGFRIMLFLGFLFPLLSGFAWFKRHSISNYPRFMKLLVFAIPLPYLAIQSGWIVTEVGRQPWVVYGLLRTSKAVSPISVSQVAASLGAFALLYSLFVALYILLLIQAASQNPDQPQMKSV
ncbi:MAG: cytochrome ubiquinol oxidase subunit I [Candidatus Riflebacteria bacterium]|nr:cytochrome ubiquinol oxidase subunit I [Candidatus Riflebacteria bacterium]